jgi:hypothetical protein
MKQQIFRIKPSFWGINLTQLILCVVLNISATAEINFVIENTQRNRIQPYSENPMYWQYKSKPIMLIGGSDSDNAFQLNYLEKHLDEMVAHGGNYIRNTMGWSRKEDVWPYIQNEKGLFDLNKPNPEFFKRFEKLLKLAYDRDIIVQVEIWATWNYYMKGQKGYPKRGWGVNPFNPINNINYTIEESGLPKEIDYSKSKYPGEHTFFYTRTEEKDLPIVRKYQEDFVDRILEISFRYPNVLYCMNNETNEAHSWGQYWAQFIQNRALARGVSVETSDMYDLNSLTNPRHRMILDDPAYTFIDISQNNFHTGETHYELVRYLYEYSSSGPKKPLNNTKIYGGNFLWSYDLVGESEGIARFIRNLFGGAASMRFHRRTANPYEKQENYYGLGLGSEAKTILKSMSMLFEKINPWELKPTYSHLLNLSRNKAYTLADPEYKYVVYLTNGGGIKLDLRDNSGMFQVLWLDMMSSEWKDNYQVEAGELINLQAPGMGPWIIVVIKQ